MAKFNLEIDDAERDLIMYALGSIFRVEGSYTLAQRIASLSIANAARPSQSEGMPPVVETVAPVPSRAQPAPPTTIRPIIGKRTTLFTPRS